MMRASCNPVSRWRTKMRETLTREIREHTLKSTKLFFKSSSKENSAFSFLGDARMMHDYWLVCKNAFFQHNWTNYCNIFHKSDFIFWEKSRKTNLKSSCHRMHSSNWLNRIIFKCKKNVKRHALAHILQLLHSGLNPC